MSSSNKRIDANEDGVFVLRMNKAYGVIGYICIAFAGITGIIAAIAKVQSSADFWSVIFIVLLICGLGTPLVLVARNQKVVVTDEEVINYGMTGKRKEILWKDVDKVQFNKVSLELKLTARRTSISLHMHLVGFNKFIELMQKYVNDEKYCDALAQIKSVQQGY
jgi:hypothetical protein